MDTKKILNIKNTYRIRIYLIFIVLFAFYLRTFNINWDQNHYFHPDERAIIMFVTDLSMPKTFQSFINTNSPLNPNFFAYGNMPLYLLKITGEIASNFDITLNQYGGLHIIGRLISALFDTLSVFLVFLLGSKVFSYRSGIWASVLYAFSVFPIQVSHFFAVDTLLTSFLLASVYILILLVEKQKIKLAILLGIIFGLSLATKISALVFFATIFFAFLGCLSKKGAKLKKLFSLFTITLFTATIVFIITQPYVLIDYKEFFTQTRIQMQMSKDPYIFPYTLQYVDKIPYLNELKNIFFWGQGPIIAVLSFLGFVLSIFNLYKVKKHKESYLIILFFTCIYFFLFGSFAVGWMRYMLPIYPFLAIFGGFFISEFIIKKLPKVFFENIILKKVSIIGVLIVLSIYPFSFMSIYTKTNTKIQASDWINKNIPKGSSIAVEHWDDRLPMETAYNYNMLELTLYDQPDDDKKWRIQNAMIEKAEYIILASNRLYTPLPKLWDCTKYLKCYPKTAEYYKKLFNGKLGFKKIAEFSSYPTIPFTNLHLVDDKSDESFTVYDHPKVLIFKKSN